MSLCLIFCSTTRKELVELFCTWESRGPQNLDNLSKFTSLHSQLREDGFDWSLSVCLRGYSSTTSSPSWPHPIAYNYGTLAFLFFMFLPHFNILEILKNTHTKKRKQNKTTSLQWSFCSPGKLCCCLTRAALCPNDAVSSGCVSFSHILSQESWFYIWPAASDSQLSHFTLNFWTFLLKVLFDRHHSNYLSSCRVSKWYSLESGCQNHRVCSLPIDHSTPVEIG